MTPARGTVAAGVLALAVLGAACGGGSHGASGPPTALPLPGAGPIPVSQLTSAASQMCGIVAQSRSDPAHVLDPFYRGPHDTLHLLAAVAHASHPTQAQSLLDVMLTYEGDIAATPPPASTGAAAAALLGAVDTTLSVLGVPPPAC